MLVNKSTILMKNVNRGNCVCGGRGWTKYENSILSAHSFCKSKTIKS